MNKTLNLAAVIMGKKPGYTAGKKHKIFNNLLHQNFTVNEKIKYGVQFTSWDFVMFCKEHEIMQSMSKAGCPYDNAPMERFYNTFKSCFYYRFTFESIEMLGEMTKKYVNWYNYVRPHSYNNYLTPMEAHFN